MTVPTIESARGPSAPAATRSRPPGWRNPRLLLGLALVAASVVVGARVVAAADDSVGVWALAHDLPAGASLSADDLVRRQVRFADGTTADRYVAAGDDVPPRARLDHDVSAGELLPRAALRTDEAQHLVEVPISVASDDLPATVREGSHVDVWVTPKEGTVSGAAAAHPTATPALSDVVVVAVPRRGDSLAPQETRQLIVGVPAARVASLGGALGGMSAGHVVIARRG